MQTTRSQYGLGASLLRQEPDRRAGVAAPVPELRGGRPGCQKTGAENCYGPGPPRGGISGAPARAAEITISREYRMNRQSGAPMEGRAVLAHRDYRLDEIV